MIESEEIYSSFERACEEGNITSAEEYLHKLELLTKKNIYTNEIYSKAIVIALKVFKEKFSSTKVKRFIVRISELIVKNPSDKKLVDNYAKALRFSLEALKTKGEPNVMRNILTDLETLAYSNPDNIAISEELSAASHEITNYWKNRGDYKELRERTQKLRALAQKFPANEEINLNLTKSLILEIDSSKKSDISTINNLIFEIQQIAESIPTNEWIQFEWLHAYRTAMDRGNETLNETKQWLESMKKISENRKDETFKIELVKGYLNVITLLGEFNLNELLLYLNELKIIVAAFQGNLEMQIIYAQSLIKALQILSTSDIDKSYEIIKEIRKLVDNYPTNKVIIGIYLESLIGVIGLLMQEQRAKDIVPLIESFDALVKKYPEDEFMLKTFNQLLETLKMLGFEKKEKKKSRMDFI